MNQNQHRHELNISSKPGKLCELPWSGLTINPDGNLVVCCSSVNPVIKHISKVDDLQKFFTNSIEYNSMRQQFKNNVFPKYCFTCEFKKSRGLSAPIDTWTADVVPNNNPPKNLSNKDMPILYLDLSLSNVCNQTCIMCGPLYSSKWYDLEKKIQKEQTGIETMEGREGRLIEGKRLFMNKLSEEDFQKILKVLPTVEVIQLKGGEPLVEKRNFIVMSEAARQKRPPRIVMTTNLSLISKDAWKAVEEYPRGKLRINISLDGIGKQYEWIRGGDYSNTMKNIERLCKSGHSICVRTSLTLHSSFNVPEQIQVIHDNTDIRDMDIGLVTSPMYTSNRLIPQPMLEEQKSRTADAVNHYTQKGMKFHELENFYNVRCVNTLADVLKMTQGETEIFYQQKLHQAKLWTDFFNKQRGIAIQDHVPELKQLFNY